MHCLSARASAKRLMPDLQCLTSVNTHFTLTARLKRVNDRELRLRQLFEDDNPRGVNPEHVRKIRQILGLMNAAQKIADLDYATFRLHPLTGNLKGFWSVTVRELANYFSVRGRQGFGR